ncbi:RNA polymerase sigma factor [Steroidobacter sp.]|uniref:RNA polymerase sigma factor n=1 Tax=Steroidobacter sp. TaxID=1978227 RepID=UPI001A50F0E1|nr:sigma-70 family RNA polymerase sigma factor [Steroidobacter sp.]MBL8268610.1 sigma-70 family RNA polymerase sigma factor [Steroidobacter sp.]
MDETLDAWFKREILVHEAALVRFLNRWPNRSEVHDLRQEVYIRVYEAAARARPTSSPKTFLFQTARHLLIDRVRRSRIVSIEGVPDLDVAGVLVDDVLPERRVQARQELNLLARAFARLPPKCREVMWLRRVDQLSQNEVATRLGITESSVEKHVIKGTRLLADAVFGQSVRTDAEREPEGLSAGTVDRESEHGKQP